MSNPLNLHLGQNVFVNRVCSIEYDLDLNRVVVYNEEYIPSVLVVVGLAKKALGELVVPRPFLSGHEQAKLRVSKYVWLYEVKETITSKSWLALPEDIKA